MTLQQLRQLLPSITIGTDDIMHYVVRRTAESSEPTQAANSSVGVSGVAQHDNASQFNTDMSNMSSQTEVGGRALRQVGGRVLRQVGGGILRQVGGKVLRQVGGGILRQVGGKVLRQVGGGILRQVGGRFLKQVGGRVLRQVGGRILRQRWVVWF